MKKRVKIIYIFFLALLLCPASVKAGEEFNKVERIAGPSRVETSIEVSKKTYSQASNAILVGYGGEIDALTGSILAGSKEAPLLYVNKEYLSKIKDLLVDLQVEQLYILGGEKVFSSQLEEEFKEYNPIRFNGRDRYETATMISREVAADGMDEIFLALAEDNLADALAIGPVAAAREQALFLSYRDKIPDFTLDAIRDMKVKKVHIIGGSSAISDGVERELEKENIETDRTFGNSREETAIAVCKKFNPNAENIVVTNGWNYADAVIGGYFSAIKDASILLSPDSNIDLPSLDFIKSMAKDVYILGGENSISPLVQRDIDYALRGYEIRDKARDEIIPYKTINRNDPGLKKGSQKLALKGADGVQSIEDRLIFKDGELIESRKLKNIRTKKPIDELILIGSKEEILVKKERLFFIRENVNLREKPSNTSKRLLTIPKGTHLDVLSTEGSWYKVKYSNKTGYLSTAYVKKASGYKAGDTLLVNKGYPLSSNFNPGVNPQASKAVKQMKADAKKSGIKLNVFSDFRTYNYQKSLYNRYVKENGQKKTDSFSARPGHSEHQSGLAFDIGGANSKYYTSSKLGQMKEGLWMAKNSYKYGLILRYPKGKEHITGYKYEPWHFRYVGVDLAKKLKDRGLTLDEYFKAVSPDYK